jgi:metallo-beta-lactamase family protein
MKITFHGAARTVTGSKHLLHIQPDKKILLDCGMFQGMGKDTMTLNRNWGFDPAEITYVIISHAHIDHIGLLPKLVKDGFSGPIYCTPQTEELGRILMLDSAKIQESDIRHINKLRDKQGRPWEEPLYTEDDVHSVLGLITTIKYDEPYKIDSDVELLYTDCGHILGSAAVNLKIKRKRESEKAHIQR